MSKHRGEMAGVQSVSFDRTAHALRVAFATGAVYEFADVPEQVYDELVHSEAPDEYFDANIREDFASTRVGDVDLDDVVEELREDKILASGWEDVDAGDGGPDDSALARRAEAGEALEGSTTERAGLRRSHHRWVVDLIDEDSAAVEVDGRQITPLPRWILPADARDGDVLRVTHDRSGTRSTIAIRVDPEATRLADDRSARQLEGKGTGDAGGDIAL